MGNTPGAPDALLTPVQRGCSGSTYRRASMVVWVLDGATPRIYSRPPNLVNSYYVTLAYPSGTFVPSLSRVFALW